uniref:Uncharacterized protein n=1 Tax=Arundo donax TaxID=35708 RepID=A0A0A9G414_ARUDO
MYTHTSDLLKYKTCNCNALASSDPPCPIFQFNTHLVPVKRRRAATPAVARRARGEHRTGRSPRRQREPGRRWGCRRSTIRCLSHPCPA